MKQSSYKHAFFILIMLPAFSLASEYTVQEKDSLWQLSIENYSDGYQWKRIWNANKQIENPNLIFPGQHITIPKNTSFTTNHDRPENITVPLVNKAESLSSQVYPKVKRPLDYGVSKTNGKTVIHKNQQFFIVDVKALKPEIAAKTQAGKGIFIDQSLFNKGSN